MWTLSTLFMGLYFTLSRGVIEENSSKLPQLQAAEWYGNSMNYWPFEELSNGTVKDHTGSNHGRIGGGFRTVSGIVGSALALSGNGSWVDFSFLQSTCLNSPSTCSTGFTVAFWLKIPDFQGNRVILQLAQHRNSRGLTVWTRTSRSKGNLAFSVNTRRRSYSWYQDWTNDDWNHIAVKWDNTNSSLTIYFNCTIVEVVNISKDAEYSDNNKTSRLILGASHAIKKNIKLTVDEFAIWNYTLEDDILCKVFNTRSVHGDYTNWSSFSDCSLSCGNGTKQRTRNCSNPIPGNRGRNCSSLGPSEEHMTCFHRECPIDGNYSHWSKFSPCSQTCGNGTTQRTRKCSNPEPRYGGRDCSHLGLEIDTRECNILWCPINGGYTPWSEFSQCDKSCGNGTRHRTRSCTNPSPKYGGLNCSHLGAEIEKEKCNTGICPIHGGYNQWTAFSECTKSCGNGTKQRSRTCSNPKPEHGGLNCSSLGSSIEIKKCNTHYCPVNGGYTFWTDFSSCSKSCGNGVQRRTRNCSSPAPLHGGKNCLHLGNAVEKRDCFLRICPVHGGFTQWSPFSECSTPCGYGIRNRTRECANPRPKHGGKECVGEGIEIEVCNMFPCPSHGGYTTWSKFSRCSKSCGNGRMERTRRCSNPPPKHGGNDCSLLGPPKETRDCNVFSCPIHGNYSSWSKFSKCSKTCGNGTTLRARNCSNPSPLHGGKNCSSLGPAEEIKSCNVFPCPIHGNYSSWSVFSSCSKTCGNGTKLRTRNCSNPVPKHGGRNCSSLGFASDVRDCNVFPCPIHGNYSSWSNFSLCSKSCGGGIMQRRRNCSNPAPRHGGRNCSHLGPAMDERGCNKHPCPIDGWYSPWGAFGECSKTCGNDGVSQRTRNCSNPLPRFGGRNCTRLGRAVDEKPCFLRPCPVDGGYSEWSNFSRCSRSCNGGNKTRTRQCTLPIPQHGGQDCSRLGHHVEVRPCNTFPCPVDGGYSEWGEFVPCTKTCEGGKQIRRRNCTNPPPLYGGRNCSQLGPSVESNDCNPQNCPDISFRVTVNFTSERWDDRSELPTKIRNGVKQILGKETVSEVKDFNFRNGSVIANFSISLFHRYYQGITRLQDAIYMDRKLTEDLPVTGVRIFSTDVPSMAPPNISVSSSSSSSVHLEWSPIPTDFTNGAILSYRLTYYFNATRSKEARNMSLDGAHLSADVNGLEKFTAYCFRIAGINHRGVGVDTMPVCASTDEDKPSLAPSNVTGGNVSSSSILVRWSSIPQQFVPGVLLGYRVHFSDVDRKGHGDANTSTVIGNTSTVIANRLMYTTYKIQVSGFTAKGEGPLSDAILVSTDEDVPSKPPANLTANNLTSTSVKVRWKALSPRDVNGILLGYKISYIGPDPNHRGKWNETAVPQNATSAVITNLRKFTTYSVCVEAFTVKGSGIPSKSVAVTTAEDRPDASPWNLTGFDESSTELFVEWQPIPKQEVNGVLKGYEVWYAPSKSYQPINKTIVDSSMSSTTLLNLTKFTNYTIKVAGFTSKGLGPYSPAIKRRTSEDVPSRAAMSVKAWNTSHTSLRVAWGDIPTGFVHGVLRGFRVFFWRANESRKTHKTKVVDGERRSIELKDLSIFTNYSIEVRGFTSAGNGTASKTLVVSTDEFTPSRSPVDVRAVNKTSPTKILVEWNPIPDPFHVHGILRGYRVFYTVIAVANDSIEDAMETNVVTVGPKFLSVELLNLEAFTRYEIQVLAFTVKGDGVKSKPIRAETCNCHSTLHTNWWISPPYVDSADSNKSGIITPILKRVIRTCCERCTEHGFSGVDFDHTAEGEPAKKSGLVQFKRSFEENTELHYPVFGFMDQTRYSNNYGFVPFVQSPGVALIIIGDEEGTAARLLLSTLALCWPILFLSIVMLWVSSTALWFVETAYNERHFPHNVLQGSWEAIWWAFASMTTLGYGDRIPRTPIGRLLCLSWILLGLVMLTCFNSTMTTLLTARILNKDASLYGTKIAAIQNSSEYRLAIRKNARVNPNRKEYTNLEEVYDALTNRDVKGILIDAFTVGSKKNLFNRRDLRISKLLDYSSAYGVVLGGEGKKLQKCFQKYVGEQRSEISKIVQDNVEMIEVTSKSMTVQRSKGLFDPQFPTYIRAMIACGVVLSVIWLVGAKFELAKKMGWIKLRRKAKTDGLNVPRSIKLMRNKDELKVEMSRIVSIFKMNCEYRKRVLQEKHRKELSLLAKLKKQTDSKLVKNPSFVNSIFSFSLGGRALTTVSNSYRNNRNGHIKWNSSLKKKNEIETLV